MLTPNEPQYGLTGETIGHEFDDDEQAWNDEEATPPFDPDGRRDDRYEEWHDHGGEG